MNRKNTISYRIYPNTHPNNENHSCCNFKLERKKLLEEFLPSVVKYSQEAHIYVADNASTDESVEFVKANFPDITIIKNKGNYGYAKGYNEALQGVKEEIYALVNF